MIYGATEDFVKYCLCLLHLDLDSAPLHRHDGCGCVNDVAIEAVALRCPQLTNASIQAIAQKCPLLQYTYLGVYQCHGSGMSSSCGLGNLFVISELNSAIAFLRPTEKRNRIFE